MNLTKVAVASAVALVFASAAGRAENMAIVTADVALGPLVSGPAVGLEALPGRVVLLEFWNIHCEPCMASLPKLEAMHRELSPQGLVVVGAHMNGDPVVDVLRAVGDLKITFTIVDQAMVRDGMDFGGIPHCIVFDHVGKCVYRGSPEGAQDAVKAALGACPSAILAGRSLTKLAALPAMIRREADFGAVLKRARAQVGSKDPDTADEARFIVDRLEGRGRELLDQARQFAETDPYEATVAAQRCAAAFKGCDIGGEAGKLLLQWKKDRAFQVAYLSGEQLAKLEELKAAAAMAPGGVTPEVKFQAAQIVRLIEKNWPESEAATKAAAIVAEMNVVAAPKP